VICGVVVLAGLFSAGPSVKPLAVKTKCVSFDFTSKILEKGKYISVSGEMYYDLAEKKMITHLTKPFENITIANSLGEVKIYDPKENSVVYSNNQANTTESSYFHHFFNSSSSDMGLQKLGFVIIDTKIDDGMFVTKWAPKEPGRDIKRIELAHQKSNIMYMGIISQKEKPLGKVFFSKHTKTGEFVIPLSITELGYSALGDSTITKKIYSNPKTNEQVNAKYLNYQIPKDAKVVKAGK
jgi:hypothetical protein